MSSAWHRSPGRQRQQKRRPPNPGRAARSNGDAANSSAARRQASARPTWATRLLLRQKDAGSPRRGSPRP
eukprot:6317627-Lingulodinium_polyedra.AAC.1